MPKILIIDCATGEEVTREMNKEELAQYKKDQEEAAKNQPDAE